MFHLLDSFIKPSNTDTFSNKFDHLIRRLEYGKTPEKLTRKCQTDANISVYLVSTPQKCMKSQLLDPNGTNISEFQYW